MIDSLAGAVEILQASPTIKVNGLLPNYPFIFHHFDLTLTATRLGYGQYFLYLCPMHNAQETHHN